MEDHSGEVPYEDEELLGLADEVGHSPEYSSSGRGWDGYICSCGWKSEQYNDSEIAWKEWRTHAIKVLGEQNNPVA